MINGFKKVKSWRHFNLGSVWFELPVLWSLSKNYTRRQSVLTILCIDTKLFTPLKYPPNVCLFTTETRYSEAIPPIRVSTLIQNIRDPLHVCLLLVALYACRCPTNGLSYCFIAHNAFVSTTIFPTLTAESTHCNWSHIWSSWTPFAAYIEKNGSIPRRSAFSSSFLHKQNPYTNSNLNTSVENK